MIRFTGEVFVNTNLRITCYLHRGGSRSWQMVARGLAEGLVPAVGYYGVVYTVLKVMHISLCQNGVHRGAAVLLTRTRASRPRT